MIKNNFYLFWGGIYSQWYEAPMTINGVEYNCCEQYMMAMKAVLFEDDDILKQIMDTTDPKKQKSLGRKVKNFNQSKWESICKDIVFVANMNKFRQNPQLQADMLMQPDNIEWVEASPYDKIWGIGLGADNKLAWDKDTWQGTNWLGEAITKVRDILIKEKENEV